MALLNDTIITTGSNLTQLSKGYRAYWTVRNFSSDGKRVNLDTPKGWGNVSCTMWLDEMGEGWEVGGPPA